MSIHLDCPHCGRRVLEEFVYGEIPSPPATLTDPEQRNLDRAFMLTNPEGPTTERWFHSYGCRRWITITRDTLTNQILPRIARPA